MKTPPLLILLLCLCLWAAPARAAQLMLLVGTTANDGTGEGLRNSLVKVNTNFTELYSTVSGLGSLATLSAAPAGTLTGTALASNVVTSSLTTLGTLADNTRITFNPGASAAGLNVGSHAGNPATLVNGDMWYNSATGQLMAYIEGGVNVIEQAGGGGATTVTAASNFGTDNVLIRADGTGIGVKSSGIVVDDSNNISGVADLAASSLIIGATAVTASGAEINALDGIPAGLTAIEIGYMDGATSAVQTQINLKGNLAGGNTWTGPQVFPSGQALIAPALGTIGSGVGTALTALNGSNVSTGTVAVANGGTGVATLTAYAPVFGGTTGTGAVQSGTVGTAGQVLMSNGAGALPSFQTAPSGAPSVATLTDAATVTPAVGSSTGGILTTLSQTTTFANPTGTPVDHQKYTLRIKSATARSISFGSQYRWSADLPAVAATSGSGLTDYLIFQWNAADSKWDAVGKNFGF